MVPQAEPGRARLPRKRLSGHVIRKSRLVDDGSVGFEDLPGRHALDA